MPLYLHNEISLCNYNVFRHYIELFLLYRQIFTFLHSALVWEASILLLGGNQP